MSVYLVGNWPILYIVVYSCLYLYLCCAHALFISHTSNLSTLSQNFQLALPGKLALITITILATAVGMCIICFLLVIHTNIYYFLRSHSHLACSTATVALAIMTRKHAIIIKVKFLTKVGTFFASFSISTQRH